MGRHVIDRPTERCGVGYPWGPFDWNICRRFKGHPGRHRCTADTWAEEQRLVAEMTAVELDFGDDIVGEFVPTIEQVIAELRLHVCSLDEPWAGPDYHNDHGHTGCLMIGWAIKFLSDAHPT